MAVCTAHLAASLGFLPQLTPSAIAIIVLFSLATIANTSAIGSPATLFRRGEKEGGGAGEREGGGTVASCSLFLFSGGGGGKGSSCDPVGLFTSFVPFNGLTTGSSDVMIGDDFFFVFGVVYSSTISSSYNDKDIPYALSEGLFQSSTPATANPLAGTPSSCRSRLVIPELGPV